VFRNIVVVKSQAISLPGQLDDSGYSLLSKLSHGKVQPAFRIPTNGVTEPLSYHHPSYPATRRVLGDR